MGLIDFQTTVDRFDTLAFDTAPIIYFAERNPKYIDFVRYVFTQISSGNLIAYTSTISLSEVLVHPYKHSLILLERGYKNLLLHTDNFHTITFDESIAIKTAKLRAKSKHLI